MTKLYEKVNHGDRRTIVRKYDAGTLLSTASTPPQTIKLNADVAVKVTQEYNAYKRVWIDVSLNLEGMVETLSASMPRPEPTHMPGPIEMPVAGPGASRAKANLPRAEVLKPWWKFWS